MQLPSLQPITARVSRPQVRATCHQESRWDFYRSTQYPLNLGGAFRIRRPIVPERIFAIFGKVIERHKILRCRFRRIDNAVYMIDGDSNFDPKFQDVHASTEQARLDIVRNLGSTFFYERFQLETEAPIRLMLFRLAPNDFVFIFAIDHMAIDGASLGIVLSEVFTLNPIGEEKQFSSLPAVRLQFQDYALWERSEEQQNAFRARAHYWKERLLGASNLVLPRPTSHLRDIAFSPARFRLDAERIAIIHKAVFAHNTTVHVFFLAAYVLALSEVTGSKDLVVGTVSSTRTSKALAGTVGPLFTLDVLRFDLENIRNFSELLLEVQRIYLEAIRFRIPAHPGYMDRVSALLNFNYLNYTPTESGGENIIERVTLERDFFSFSRLEPPVQLACYFTCSKAHASADLHFDPREVDSTGIARIASHFRGNIEKACETFSFRIE